MKEEKYTADNITALSRAEWLWFRLKDANEKVDLIYVIIGYLLEHFGGYSKHDEIVDGFFVNEKEKAQLFADICREYLRRNSLSDDVIFNKSATGHSQVLSKTICSILNDFYTVREPDFLSHVTFTLKEDDLLYGPPSAGEMFNLRQLGFLIGAFLRRKIDDNTIAFTSGSKADLSIKYLKDFSGFAERSISVSYNFGIPETTVINLPKECVFWKIVNNLLDSIPGYPS